MSVLLLRARVSVADTPLQRGVVSPDAGPQQLPQGPLSAPPAALLPGGKSYNYLNVWMYGNAFDPLSRLLCVFHFLLPTLYASSKNGYFLIGSH